MLARAHPVVLIAIVAGAACPLPTRADVYTWTDKAGVTNISNLPPPEGVRTVSVTRAAPKDPAREAAFREAAREAEMRALNERVQQLQAEIEQARREPAPAPVVPQSQHAPAPPVPYVIVVSPPAPTYPQQVAGCDYAWGNCGLGFWPGFYPPSVVVVRDRPFRHHRPIHHGNARPIGGLGIPPAVHSAPGRAFGGSRK
jgi:hypothetical protein